MPHFKISKFKVLKTIFRVNLRFMKVKFKVFFNFPSKFKVFTFYVSRLGFSLKVPASGSFRLLNFKLKCLQNDTREAVQEQCPMRAKG